MVPIFIARQHTNARYSYSKSVCPSIRYVLVPDENGLKYRHSFFSRYGSPIILFLSVSNIFTKSDGVTPSGGAKYAYRWGIKISRFSTNKSLYLANDARYRHSQYGRRQELVRDLSNGAISNDLKRTLTLFSRSHHSLTLNISQTATDTAIVRQIINRTQAFEWHQFQ